MKYNIFGYLIGEGFRNVFKNKKSTFACLGIMCATMLIFGIFYMIGENIDHALEGLEEDFNILSGEDGLTLPIMALGGTGVISASANVDPRRMVLMVDSMLNEDYQRAQELHYEMIKYAINNGYKYYNLYEIGNITDDNNKLKNSYNYKKNFGGEVVELVGEYDLVIDPKYTDMARKHFPEYLGVKTIFK